MRDFLRAAYDDFIKELAVNGLRVTYLEYRSEELIAPSIPNMLETNLTLSQGRTGCL